jgi:hypothetical protein
MRSGNLGTDPNSPVVSFRHSPLLKSLLRVNRLAFVSGSPHHYVSILLSPNRSRVLMSQSADELQTGDGLAIAHDVRRGSG